MFDQLSEKLTQSLKNIRKRGVLTEDNMKEALREIRLALLEADVNFKVVKSFIDGVKEKAIGEKVLDGLNPGQQLVEIVHKELTRILGEERSDIQLNRAPPAPVMLVGLQGVGKTTLSAKLALYLKKKFKKAPLLVPADIYRPAAKNQLEILGKQIDIPVYDSDLSKTPTEIAKAAKEFAYTQGCDVMLIDTAGRLQLDEELMQELVDLKNATDPSEILFVADAMTGQEAVNVANSFHEKLGLTGVGLTKMDGDARGGAALSIKAMTGIPVKLVGMGEKVSDLEPFYPDRIAGRILDMGDILTLVEKAHELVDEKEAMDLSKKIQKNEFDIEDFRNQLKQMKKLGSIESLMKMIPGMGGAMKKIKDFSPAEDEMKQIEAIINSMTKAERQNHKILNGSRRKRIALGSGTAVADVNRFIKRFMEMKKMMAQFSKGGMANLMKGMKF